MSTNPITARKKARVIVMQALYQWAMADTELHVLEIQFMDHNDFSKLDGDYFHELLFEIPKNLSEIDQAFSAFLDRELESINPIELAILRVATYEMVKRLDVPYKVVINEALGLAKKFGSSDGHKYVNGVLDKVAKQYRAAEMQS